MGCFFLQGGLGKETHFPLSFFFFILCKVSKATKMLSEINLSLVKADWCSVIMDESIFFRRLQGLWSIFCKAHYIS